LDTPSYVTAIQC